MSAIEISVYSLIGMGIFLGIIRLIFSKNLTEKVVVLDAMTTAITGIIVFMSAISNIDYLIDIALIYAILSFAGVIIVSRYLERGY